MSDEVPMPTTGVCVAHASRELPRFCPLCKLDDLERTLQRLADPMSTCTPAGVVKLAADTLARWRR